MMNLQHRRRGSDLCEQLQVVMPRADNRCPHRIKRLSLTHIDCLCSYRPQLCAIFQAEHAHGVVIAANS